MWLKNNLPNNAAEAYIARNNSVLESVQPPKLINIAKSMETLANWLSVFKNHISYIFENNNSTDKKSQTSNISQN